MDWMVARDSRSAHSVQPDHRSNGHPLPHSSIKFELPIWYLSIWASIFQIRCSFRLTSVHHSSNKFEFSQLILYTCWYLMGRAVFSWFDPILIRMGIRSPTPQPIVNFQCWSKQSFHCALATAFLCQVSGCPIFATSPRGHWRSRLKFWSLPLKPPRRIRRGASFVRDHKKKQRKNKWKTWWSPRCARDHMVTVILFNSAYWRYIQHDMYMYHRLDAWSAHFFKFQYPSQQSYTQLYMASEYIHETSRNLQFNGVYMWVYCRLLTLQQAYSPHFSITVHIRLSMTVETVRPVLHSSHPAVVAPSVQPESVETGQL
jgi:hypothetical protein